MSEKSTKEDLEKLYLQILHQKKKAEETGKVTDFFKKVLDFNKNALNDEGLTFILNTLEHFQDHSVFHELWKMLEEHPIAYETVIEFINLNQDYTDLIEVYLNEKFKLTSVDDILYEINRLLAFAPYLVKNRRFQVFAIQKTAYAVGDSPDIFKAATTVKEFKPTNSEVDFTHVKNKMMEFSIIAVLDEIEFKSITLEDIDTFGQLTAERLNAIALKDSRIIIKYRMMMALSEIFSTSTVSVSLVLKQLPPQSREELREVLKNILGNNLSSKYFHHILAAFDNEEGSYHFPQLFAYLSKNADKELMVLFIKWSANNLRIDHHYHRGLKNYLKTHPRSVWKNKSGRKELESIPSSSFRKIVKEVKNEKASPLIKLVKKYGVQFAIILLTLGVGSGLYLGYDLLADKKNVAAFSKTSKPSATGQVETKKAEPELEPFKKWVGEIPFIFNVNGEQQKMTFGQANPDGGKTLVLTDSQNNETSFDLVINSEITPFDEKGVLKDGISLYHAEHDFDGNGNPEIVIMALSQTYESFVWVYSPISENGSIGLRADLTLKGMSDAKLAGNTLKILVDHSQSETYSFINQQFVKQ